METIDGYPVMLLGKGLESGGQPCPVCRHKGYVVEPASIPCDACDEYGKVPTFRGCVACAGSGRYSSSGKLRSCDVCGGAGKIRTGSALAPFCPKCQGRRMVKSVTHNVFHRCGNCQGIGEVRQGHAVAAG